MVRLIKSNTKNNMTHGCQWAEVFTYTNILFVSVRQLISHTFQSSISRRKRLHLSFELFPYFLAFQLCSRFIASRSSWCHKMLLFFCSFSLRNGIVFRLRSTESPRSKRQASTTAFVLLGSTAVEDRCWGVDQKQPPGMPAA